MARDEKRRQQSLQRKATKRKQHRASLTPTDRPPSSARGLAKRAANWRVLEVLVANTWSTPGALVHIFVAREAPSGEIGLASFLVDLGCLGVKDSFVTLLPHRAAYELGPRASALGNQVMQAAEPADAARIITEAVQYARGLGFAPRGDYHAAMAFLRDADPAASDWVIPLGVDGKPMYLAGPYDNVAAIMATLDRAVGADNYDFLASPSGFMPLRGDEVFYADDDEEGEAEAEDEDDAGPPFGGQTSPPRLGP